MKKRHFAGLVFVGAMVGMTGMASASTTPQSQLVDTANGLTAAIGHAVGIEVPPVALPPVPVAVPDTGLGIPAVEVPSVGIPAVDQVVGQVVGMLPSPARATAVPGAPSVPGLPALPAVPSVVLPVPATPDLPVVDLGTPAGPIFAAIDLMPLKFDLRLGMFDLHMAFTPPPVGMASAPAVPTLPAPADLPAFVQGHVDQQVAGAMNAVATTRSDVESVFGGLTGPTESVPFDMIWAFIDSII